MTLRRRRSFWCGSTGEPPHGVGPHDVAIALCGAVYKNGFVKNKVLEFAGPAMCPPAHGLPHRHRRDDHGDRLPQLHLGDGRSRGGLSGHSMAARETFTALHPQDGAYYDGMIDHRP